MEFGLANSPKASIQQEHISALGKCIWIDWRRTKAQLIISDTHLDRRASCKRAFFIHRTRLWIGRRWARAQSRTPKIIWSDGHRARVFVGIQERRLEQHQLWVSVDRRQAKVKYEPNVACQTITSEMFDEQPARVVPTNPEKGQSALSLRGWCR